MRAGSHIGWVLLSTFALTSCAPAPAKVYRRLATADESRVLRDLAEVVQLPATRLKPGKKLSAELASTDPMFTLRSERAEVPWKLRPSARGADTLHTYVRSQTLLDGLGAHERQAVPEVEPGPSVDSIRAAAPGAGEAEFRTYFDLFQARIEEPGDYEITVEPKRKGSGAFRSTAIDPIVRLLSPSGQILAVERAKRKHWRDLPTKVIYHHLTPGDYFVFVGADNSHPGAIVGVSKEQTGGTYTPKGGFIPGVPFDVTIGASGEGAYTVSLKPAKKH